MNLKIFILPLILVLSISVSGQLKVCKRLSNYEESINFCYQKYPELGEIKIKVKAKRMCKRSMAARPNAFFLLQKDNSYIIAINRRKKVLDMYSEGGFKGIFGHELAHILEYTEMSDKELLQFSWKYVMQSDFKMEVEHRVDSIALSKDFGTYLIEGVESQFENRKYWKRKEGIYYTPQKLEKLHHKIRLRKNIQQ